MIGNNKIEMCPAEMYRAVEFYLNTIQLKEKVVVMKIEHHNGVYTVDVAEPPKDEATDG